MPFQATLLVVDSETPCRAELYLPGAPVDLGPSDEALCLACDEFVDAYEDPITGYLQRHDAAEGHHQGILAIYYSPVEGAPEMLMEYEHLWCAIDTCTSLRAACLVIGDPEINSYYQGRHRHENQMQGS